jgi:hypothetical protein
MDRRDLSKAVFAGLAGATVVPRMAQSQTCTPSCYPQTPAEAAAQVVPVDNTRIPGDLRRYGAIGGSTSADNRAWAAAIAQANAFGTSPPVIGAPIYVPATVSGFAITAAQTLNRPARIYGDGYLSSFLNDTTDAGILILNSSSASTVIEGVGFTGFGVHATAACLTLESAHHCVFNNIRIAGFGLGINFVSGSSYLCTISNSRIEGNLNRNIWAATDTNGLRMIGVAFGSSGDLISPIGMSIFDSNSLYMAGCDCEGVTRVCIDIDAVNTSLPAAHVITGCHFEGNCSDLGDIRIGATKAVTGVTVISSIFAPATGALCGINAVNANGLVVMGCAHSASFPYQSGQVLLSTNLSNQFVVPALS